MFTSEKKQAEESSSYIVQVIPMSIDTENETNVAIAREAKNKREPIIIDEILNDNWLNQPKTLHKYKLVDGNVESFWR